MIDPAMLNLHPEILERDGKKQFVILTYEEYLRIQEALADLEDLKDLREAKAKEGMARGIPLAEVRRRLLAKR